jgi:CubicO group peptidase (beta-lactamase class C family)
MPLEFAPGAGWNYSVSTDLLGAVIQRVSGLPLDRYFDERIFAPLGMDDTGFTVPNAKIDRLTDCYALVPDEGSVIFDRGAESVWRNAPDFLSGGGGLVSTALDYHRFCTMCANGGEFEGVRLLGYKTLELMTMNHLPGRSDLASMSKSMFSETTNAGVGFGLGFAVTQDVAKAMIPGSVGEYYWGGIFSTSFFIDPVERLHAVFMTQLSPSSAYPIRRELKTLIYSALA